MIRGAYQLSSGIQLQVIFGNITRTAAVCVVNAAKPSLEGGGGVDGAIHSAAGPALLEACKRLPLCGSGVRCRTGEAVLTPGPFLASLSAQHVIHVVGPDLRSGMAISEARPLLVRTISSALTLANSAGYESVSVPAVSCGVHSNGDSAWKAEAPGVILRTCADFASNHARGDVRPLRLIILVSQDASQCSQWCAAAGDIALPALVRAGDCAGGSSSSSGNLPAAPRDADLPVPIARVNKLPYGERSSSDIAVSAVLAKSVARREAIAAAMRVAPAAVAAAVDRGGSSTCRGLRAGFAFDLPAAPRGDDGPLCSFLAIGDWGVNDSRVPQRLAANMAAWCASKGGPPPDFILALGDNFYPSGVSSVFDPAFTKRWADVFPRAFPCLAVPWCIILGNHDYGLDPDAQVRQGAAILRVGRVISFF
jgi:O-acetyl-ADP-ribose deacetylase